MVFQGISYDTNGLVYVISNGGKGDLIHNKEKIRYAKNQVSIYVKDQHGPCKMVPLVLRDGGMVVDDNDTTLIEFLKAHPLYGDKFIELDKEKDAKIELELEEKIDEIKSAIRSKSKQKDGSIALESLLVTRSKTLSQLDVSSMGAAEIRRSLYSLVKNDPDSFLNSKGKVNCFDSNDFIYQDMVLRCNAEGVIKINPAETEVSWGNGEIILSVPKSKKAVEFFADYLATKEGQGVFKQMAQELG